jgi:Na+-transporting NADH:ubiquinone oxidoreductase subunit C
MKERILMIVFILVLGSVLTSALVAVTNYTNPIIEMNNVITVKRSILDALEISYTEDSVEDIFSDNIDIVPEEEEVYYFTQNGDVAFEISGSGLWGPIEGVIALNPGYETIKGLTIIRQEETPGLGGRIGEKEFLNQFKNKMIIPKLEITAPGKAQNKNQVDGITGATMSGKALEVLLNSEIGEHLALLTQ